MKAMSDKIRSVQRSFSEQVTQALHVEAQIEMTEAKRRTPVDTGALRASGRVETPKRNGRKMSVSMSFGGAAGAYAVIVHENPDAFHPIGQWKYLQSVLEESEPHMAARLARRMELKRT